MTDLATKFQLENMIKMMDKMHNGLRAMIDAHHELEKKLEERIKKLEELSKDK